MRRFNFNNFNLGSLKPESKPESEPKRQFSAYRSIITKHNLVNQKLADQPIGKIDSNPNTDGPQA